MSAPVFDMNGVVIAALSVSGPLERMSNSPGAKFGSLVARGARTLTEFLTD